MRLTLKNISALMTVMLFGISCGTTNGSQSVSRAAQFVKNVHTGKMMKADEWLTRKARSEPAFNAHGGLDAMVRQSTAQAERHGGLKTIEVLQATEISGQAIVKIRVLFNKNPIASTNAPNTIKEEMIWDITATKEDSVWKLSF